jgi:hypothetical protein
MIHFHKLLREISTENSTTRYCGVLLSDTSRDVLLDGLKDKIPDNWKVIAHHMTIDPFKPFSESKFCKDLEFNSSIELKVTHYGINEKAFAVKVDYPYATRNKIPHITIAINNVDGKPKDSNSITEWIELKDDITVDGTIQDL